MDLELAVVGVQITTLATTTRSRCLSTQGRSILVAAISPAPIRVTQSRVAIIPTVPTRLISPVTT